MFAPPKKSARAYALAMCALRTCLPQKKSDPSNSKKSARASRSLCALRAHVCPPIINRCPLLAPPLFKSWCRHWVYMRTSYLLGIRGDWVKMDPWRFMASVDLNMAPPFVLIRVMLLVHTNTSCRYKRVEPRHIRLTKIVIFDDNLCKNHAKIGRDLILAILIPSNCFGHFIWHLFHTC